MFNQALNSFREKFKYFTHADFLNVQWFALLSCLGLKTVYIYNRFAKFCANLPNQKDIFTVFQQPLSSSKSSNLDGDPHNESCHEQLPHGCMIQK